MWLRLGFGSGSALAFELLVVASPQLIGVSAHTLSERAVHAFKLVSYTVQLVKLGKKFKTPTLRCDAPTV